MDLKKECIQRKIKQEIKNECYNSPDASANSLTTLIKIKFEAADDRYEEVENELHALVNSEKHEESHPLKECKSTPLTKEICRLCAQSIRGSEVFLFKSNELHKKINFTLPITTSLGDGFPEYICQNCEMNLNLFYEFVCKVVNADKVIRGKVSQTDFKCNDSTNATIKQIFGADIHELVEASKNSSNKRSLEQDSVESKKSCDTKSSIPKNKPNKHVHHEDENKNRKVLKVLEDTSIHHQKTKHHYKCHRCSKYFDDYNQLVLHNKRVHMKVEYPCPDCRKIFTTENMLCQHIKVNHNAPVICSICGKIFVHTEALEKHQDNVHKIKVCHNCGVSFTSNTHYNEHRLLHENVEENQCVFCYDHFNARHKLLRHTRQCHSGSYKILVDKAENDAGF